MASISKDVADVDINKPGFFHLCYNLDKNEQTDATKTQLEFLIKRYELMIKTIKKLNVPLTQVPALNNIIAVSLFQIQGREKDAKLHLENVMRQSDTVGSNTLTNLIYIYENLENGSEIYATEIAELQERLKQCILTADSALDDARAMCERELFYEYQLKENEDPQTIIQFDKALEFFKVGIKDGGEHGMAQNELFIWKYSLVRAQMNMFSFVERLNSLDKETKQELFEAFVDSFEKFYAGVPEDCVFYKSRAVIECLQRMTLLKDALNSLPNFDAVMQQGILGEMWEDRLATMEEVFSMSPNDSKIPLVLGKMYLRIQQTDEAERYLEMSLSLESENNLYALSALLLTYSKKAKILDMEHKIEAAQEYLLKAYEKGKKLDSEVISTSTTLEMANVCYHLAIDKTTQAWSVPRHKIKYMKDAIRYNQLALDTHFEHTHMRAYKQLGDCLWKINQHGEAIEYIRKSLNYKDKLKPEHIIGTLNSLLDKASRFLNMQHVCDTEKKELLHNLATDLQFVWDNIPQHDDTKFIKMCVNFAKHLSQKNHYITTIFQEISNQNSDNGKQFLDWYCKIIQENNLPPWLKTHCLRMQQDN